jgi:hypothetical protein
MPEELNPYIGPRAFKTGEILFGRDDETQRLFDLLLAERIVLLYSPSGAGKTSLIQARIVPKLGEEDFIISRNIRMNAKPPHLDELPLGDNRYLFATKYSIDQGPDFDPWPAEKLAATTLSDYLEQRFPIPAADEPSRPIALLFDQFEEVLTLDSMDDDVKCEFFRQLGLTLRNRRIFALFAMREEFIAALDAYAKQLPTRLQTRLRLNLLDRAKAEEAIRLPAKRAGVAFTAAKKLALDLSSTRVRRGGKTEEVPGPWVEPVQLQVVCSSLWKKPRQNPQEISDDDLTGVTDVDTALGEYYEESVASIAKEGLATEREVHDWFNDHLITERGIRAQVPRDEPKSGGLDNKAVDRLLDDHLIRPEERRGTVWYELAHDRLIEPIRAANMRWEEKNLTPFQRAASRYSEGKGGLLRDAELVAGQQWVEENPKEATPAEKRFLAECIAALNPFERAVYEWQFNPDRVLSGSALDDARDAAAKKAAKNESLTPLEEAFLRKSISVRESEYLQRRWQDQQQRLQNEIQQRERQRHLWARRITAGLLVALAILVPLLFYSLRAARARKDQLELQQLAEKVARTVGPYTLENRTPVSTQDFIHRFDAQNQLSAIAAEATPQQRSQVTVEYYAKAADLNRLSNVLSKLGLQVKGVPAKNPNPSNCIWYGAQVTENDVKVVAFALIRAGVILQGIQARDASSPPLTIQIGHNPFIEDLPPLTPDAISNQSLAALKRPEAKTRSAEGIVTEFDPCTHQGTIETTTNQPPESVFFEARPDVWPFDAKGVRVTFNKGDRVMFTLFYGPVRHYAQGVKLVVVPKAATGVDDSLRSLLEDCAH